MTSRMLGLLLGAALILAACGSDSEAGSDVAADAAAQTTSTTTAVSDDSDGATTTTAPTFNTSFPTIDERTPEEAAIDQLDLMIAQLGIRDIPTAADCVIERLDEEGIELVGQGAPELVALLGCEPSAASVLLGSDSSILPPNVWDCVTNGIGAWMSGIPLDEAEEFLEAETPPADLIADLSSACAVEEDVLEAILS